MRSFTWPFEAWLHFSAISFSSSCQVEPFGASVPSLIWTWACPRAGVRTRSRAARSVFFTGGLSGSGEQVVDVAEQGACAPLGDEVGEPELRRRIDVEG